MPHHHCGRCGEKFSTWDEYREHRLAVHEAPRCKDCGETLKLHVLQSAAGYYLGRRCSCGPYSRESDYFASPGDAAAAMESGQSLT